jgi:hypothetical protein
VIAANYDGGEFVNNTDVRVTALHDLFDDRLEQTRAHFGQSGRDKGHGEALRIRNIFKGARAYERLLQFQGDVDLVLITSPPYFHPEHLEATVAAEKHVYLEKACRTDVQGCMRVIAAGKKAQGRLSLHVGFQKRYDEGYRGMNREDPCRRGSETFVLGQTFYYTNDWVAGTSRACPSSRRAYATGSSTEHFQATSWSSKISTFWTS